MKKILFIVPALSVGGLEKMQVTLANALTKKGYDVTVMLLDKDDTLKSELEKDVKLIKKPYKSHPVMSKIPYVRYKFYDAGKWETRASAKTLYKYYVGNEKYDIEIAFFRGLPIKIISGSTNENSVKLAWVHSDFRKATGYKNNFKNLRKVKDAYSKFNSVVCVSEDAKKGFIKVIGNTGNLTTVYNMLSVDKIKEKAELYSESKVNNEKFNVIIVGRLSDAVKGQIRLINAVSRLKSEGKDISLTIVGGGDDEKKIKDRIKELNASDYIIMTGNQQNPYPYIKQSDLLVCASYFEGYNLTVAEALVLGVPVLSTDCTGPNEILDYGKYGKIVDNSEEGLYNGLKELCDNPEKLKYYKKKTKERLGFFNEDKIINEIEELFFK